MFSLLNLANIQFVEVYELVSERGIFQANKYQLLCAVTVVLISAMMFANTYHGNHDIKEYLWASTILQNSKQLLSFGSII